MCAVTDATAMADVLRQNSDGSNNYTCRLLVSHDGGGPVITRASLREQWLELFSDFDGDLLFFFAGHGVETAWGGYLVTQDGQAGEWGLSMDDLLLLANRSNARQVILILDCCHSGHAGNPPLLQSVRDISVLREGVTILAASRPAQAAAEAGGHGLFTAALVDGLQGAAADHIGMVSASSLYAHVDRLFDAWSQRPLFKSHVSSPQVIRCCDPIVPLSLLRLLPQHFRTADARLKLDPDYESDGDSEKSRDFEQFKLLRNGHMIETVEDGDLYFAAINSNHIVLTLLGQYYWRLAERGAI